MLNPGELSTMFDLCMFNCCFPLLVSCCELQAECTMSMSNLLHVECCMMNVMHALVEFSEQVGHEQRVLWLS